MTDHPITPPPELLVQQWLGEYFGCDVKGEVSIPELHLAARAAQWGADQELEACCEWLVKQGWFSADEHEAIEELRFARRPKPPSLKVQALEALDHILENSSTDLGAVTIRRALEQLPDND